MMIDLHNRYHETWSRARVPSVTTTLTPRQTERIHHELCRDASKRDECTCMHPRHVRIYWGHKELDWAPSRNMDGLRTIELFGER
jgi:hypothetical protein